MDTSETKRPSSRWMRAVFNGNLDPRGRSDFGAWLFGGGRNKKKRGKR